jgi:hypothetical protein
METSFIFALTSEFTPIFAVLERIKLFFQHATSNLICRLQRFIICKILWLNYFVHDTPFGYGKLEQVSLIDGRPFNQFIILYLQSMDWVVFTQRALVDASVGKNKIIVGHHPGTLEGLTGLQKNFRVRDPDAFSRSRFGCARYNT